MNNKGQVLVVSVIILPIIFLILFYIIDLVNFNSAKKRLESIADSSLEYYYLNQKNDLEQIKKYIHKNQKFVNLEVRKENEDIILELNTNFKSMSGIIKTIKIKRVLTKEGNKYQIIRG